MRAVVLMVVAMSCIVAGDTAGKLLTQAGFAPVFVAWSRFAVAAVVLAPLCGVKRGEWAAFADWRVILRAALVAGGIASILTAFRTVPLADAFAAFFIGPVVSYVLSILFLRERVSLRRSALLALSFAGVLVVVRPGFGMVDGIEFAVLAGVFYGGYLVATRAVAQVYRPRFLLISQLAVGAVLLAPLAWEPVPEIGPAQGGLLLASALASAAGNLILVIVNRTTPASVVAPLVYTQLLAATVAGWLVFGDCPDAVVWLGLFLIVGAGVASVRVAGRERPALDR